MPPAPRYVGVSLTPDGREALRRLTVDVSAAVGRRVGMSDAIVAAAALVRRYPEEAAAILATQPNGESQ